MRARRPVLLGTALVLVAAVAPLASQLRPPAAPKQPTFFVTTPTVDQMKGKRAVLQATAGEIVIALRPERAPNPVGYFMKIEKP